MSEKKLPTIAELEEILKGEPRKIEIRPDGSIHVPESAATEFSDGERQGREKPQVLRLCETQFVGLQPEVLYRFTVDPNCPSCVELSKPYGFNRHPNEK